MIVRKSQDYLKSLYQYFPVLFVTGPRQSGKTTLVRSLFGNLPYVLLELPDQQNLAKQDLRLFLSQYPSGAIFDEAQNVPELFSYLQGIVDNDRSLRFVLTGSQNFLLNERISQSLAGRVGLSVLLPLTLQELATQVPATSFEKFIFTGFYPELYNRQIPPELFYPSYVQTYLERDVRSLQNVGDLTQFNTFLRLCAGRIGQIINLSSLASDAGLSVNTVKSWLSILEASYIIYRLQPHYKNFNKRLVKSPKLYFTDTGLACHLLGIGKADQIISHFALGALFENFIIMEFYKQFLNKGQRGNMFYWRDNKGVEIDLLIENGSELSAYEIKAGKTLSVDYFKTLSYWSSLSKTAKENCYVIYGGDVSQHTKNGLLMSWRDMIN